MQLNYKVNEIYFFFHLLAISKVVNGKTFLVIGEFFFVEYQTKHFILSISLLRFFK